MVKKLILLGIIGVQFCMTPIIALDMQCAVDTQQVQLANEQSSLAADKTLSNENNTPKNATPNTASTPSVGCFLASNKSLVQCIQELLVIVAVELMYNYNSLIAPQ